MIHLKLKEENTFHSNGYGAGEGEIIRKEYECPCGKGLVIYEKDDIPGFRDRSIYCECEDCRPKYEFGRGTAREIVK